jgi:lipopolysaccharide transport system ATP-binding protein
MKTAIAVHQLSKRYRRPDPNRPRTLQEWIIRRLKGRDWQGSKYFWALRDVNFTIPMGRMVGLIGHNGAGKSTLLRLLGSVGRAEAGQIEVNGRIGALLDLGAGLNGDLTGCENIFVAGVIGGLTRREVKARFDDIVAFAELEAFIDAPLRTYSTGMRMRLAFAVAVHIEPDILLIDEVLAVGDVAFQQKCLERIARFRAQGCTILLVSHDASVVKSMCDEAIYLQRGEVIHYGPADQVVTQYVADMMGINQTETPVSPGQRPLRLHETRFGTQEMEITAVSLHDGANLLVNGLPSGASLWIQIEYHAPKPIPSPIFGVSISRSDGLICYDTATSSSDLMLPTLLGIGSISLYVERLDLTGGDYFVNVGVYEQHWDQTYDYHWQVYPLKIHAVRSDRSILHPPQHWTINSRQDNSR